MGLNPAKRRCWSAVEEALSGGGRFPLNYISKFGCPSLLKACASRSDIRCGRVVHASVVSRGFLSDPFVASSLISMYAKCGSFEGAHHVFDAWLQSNDSTRDVTVWNSLVDACFSFGRFRDGLRHFRGMQVVGCRPDAYSLSILLGGEGGGASGLVETKQIHAHVIRNVAWHDPYLQSSLLASYLRQSRPLEAWHLFQSSGGVNNSVVTWNVMIGGFTDAGLWHKSLELYVLVRKGDLELTSPTFTDALIACSRGEDVAFGKQVHCDVIRMGFGHDPYVSTSLLTMYAKCKSLHEAENVFGSALLPERTELWNAMLSAYAGNGSAYDAFKAYRRMRSRGIQPDSVTMSNVLTCSSITGSYDFGRSIHSELIKQPTHCNISVQSALMTVYSACNNTDDAYLIFRSMKERDVIAWGSMLAGFSQNRKYKEAFRIFGEMEANGVKVDSDIVATIVTTCTRMESVVLGCAVHGYITKTGWEQDVFAATSLIDMYSKCGSPGMAERVFSHLLFKNLAAWNSMISCYSRNEMPDISVDTFSGLMSCGLDPDSLSLTSVLVAISSMAALPKGKTVHAYLIRFGILLDTIVKNALIDMYIKCGNLKYAECIFGTMSRKTLVTWNIMIAGYGFHGECLKAMRLFEEMRCSAMRPDGITFLSLISSCNHSGLTEEGLSFFDMMRLDYGVEPEMEHYASIVDLWGRAGRLDEAYEFLKSMPIAPDGSVWLSLLWSSRAHRHFEIAELAARELQKMEPSVSSNYIQTLKFYGEAELWDSTASLLTLMKEKKLKKSPGCSWIEVGNTAHAFISGQCSAPKINEVYETLKNLRMIMVKESGDVLE